MMRAYLLGLATLPALVAALLATVHTTDWVAERLRDRGWFMRLKTNRAPEEIGDYMLQHDVWFERPRGPIFTGHWYREVNGRAMATRWLGIGSASGRSIIFYRKRTLSDRVEMESER